MEKKRACVTKCKLVWVKSGKNKQLICETHKNPSLYVYDVNGDVGYRCSHGESRNLPLQFDLYEA